MADTNTSRAELVSDALAVAERNAVTMMDGERSIEGRAAFEALFRRLSWYEELQGDMNDADFRDLVRGVDNGAKGALRPERTE